MISGNLREGMSIGDSALGFTSESKLLNNIEKINIKVQMENFMTRKLEKIILKFTTG